MKKNAWPILAIIVVVICQLLIFSNWDNAKFLTVVNLVILLVAITGLAMQNFEKSFKKDVLIAMATSGHLTEVVTSEELEELPQAVQNYLRYVGVVGKPKVKNVWISFEGQMRDKGKKWFDFNSEQYNFFDQPARLFFMKAMVKGLPVHGYHSYKNKMARMHIKLLSLFPVVDIHGPEMFPTETVTYLNDMCLFAPAALIDKRISWEAVDSLCAKATFTNQGTTISAMLYFNQQGQLVNFISRDRYSVAEMKTFPFSTPVKEYRQINGFNLCTYGEAVWHYPEAAFIYGKFKVKDIRYNVRSPKT